MAYIIAKTFILTLFMLGSLVTLAWQHELVHQVIFTDHGIESKIRIHYIKGWFTGILADTTPIPNSTRCDLECDKAHEINEAVGYNISGAVIAMFSIAFAYLFIKELDNIDDKNNDTERYINPLSLSKV